MRTRRAPAPAAALLALAAAACLEVKSEDPPECKTTADCGTGEICEERVCWGNPPMGPFAALVSPPGERSGDLVLREVLTLPITGDGWLDDIHLDNAVTFKGSLETLCEPPLVCDSRALGAKIFFTRKPAFRGGPGFRKVVTVEPGGAFDVVVPAAPEGEPKYTVTVVPDGRDAVAGSTLAQLVPPLRSELSIPSSISGNLLVLGGVSLPRVSGKVLGNTSDPIANYRVVAMGRWDPSEPLTEVSTVDFTGSTGEYDIVLSKDIVGTVRIVARPLGAQLRPEIHLTGVPGDRDSLGKNLVLPAPGPGTERPVEIAVEHQEAGGAITRVSGARVTISGITPVVSSLSSRLTVDGTTDENGVVRLKVLDLPELSQTYKLSIIPPASSQSAALFEKSFTMQQSTQRLGTRFALVGKVVDAEGEPMKDVVVTARPSVRFLWNLDSGPQSFLGAIPAATTTTPNTGEFVVFVDRSFENVIPGQDGTVWGHYDLTFEPAKTSEPSWTVSNVELPRDAMTNSLDVGTVQLPDGAHVRGFVFDGEGALLEDAEVKLYRVQTDLALCSETRNEPQDCPIPALLVGRGTSAKDGVVRLTLPR
jgi:hypothetical protein